MPTDRILRYSLSGVMFAFSATFFYYFFGGDLIQLQSLTSNRIAVSIVGLVLSTPVIGLIVSTFVFFVLYLFRKDIHYYVPNDPRILEYIFNRFPEINIAPERRTSTIYWSRSEIDEFYPYYQTVVRSKIKDESMRYLERKWAAYWIQANSIGGIILSLGFSFMVVFCVTERLCFDPNCFKGMGLLVFILYVSCAWYLANRAKEHGKKFEHVTVIDELR